MHISTMPQNISIDNILSMISATINKCHLLTKDTLGTGRLSFVQRFN